MTKDEVRIAIEKNRTALLRIVLCWLLAASIFKHIPNRILPRRISAWVRHIIFSAEKATYFLRIAAGIAHATETMPVHLDSQLTIGEAIARLKAVKNALINLKHATQATARGIGFTKSHEIAHGVALKNPQPNFVTPLQRVQCPGKCRAPPTQSHLLGRTIRLAQSAKTRAHAFFA